MKVHEYQAKEILRRYGVPTPRGIVVDNPDEARDAAKELASLGPALYRVQRLELSSAELRSLLTFGWQHFRDVLVSRSGRARFGADDDRRRVIVLHEPSAREFVVARKKAVPFR